MYKSVVYLPADRAREVYGFRPRLGWILNFNADVKKASINGLCRDNQQKHRGPSDRSGGRSFTLHEQNPGKVRWSDIPKFLQDPKTPAERRRSDIPISLRHLAEP